MNARTGQLLLVTINQAAAGPMPSLIKMELGNNVWEHTNFDSRLQPIGIVLDRPSPFERLLSLSYGYFLNGNVSNHTLIAPGLSVRSQDFTYDAYNRLKIAVENRQSGSVQCPDPVGSAWCEKYGYDQYGNRWVEQSTGLVQLPITPTAASNFSASTNRIVGNGYDFAGNQTVAGNGAFSYDAENRQTKVVPNLVGIDPAPNTSQYYYDGEGRRVKREVFGRTRVYVYGPSGQLWKEYVYAGGRLLALEDQNPVGRSYLTTDHLGSTRLVTNASGNVESRHDYLPFGKEIPVELGGRSSVPGYGAQENILQRFTGKEVDPETGLQYFGARYYSGRQGRFTSVDPSGESVDDVNPQTWNGYTYSYNNPLRYTDPTGAAPDGKDVLDFFLGVAKGAASTISLGTQPGSEPSPTDTTASLVGQTIGAAGAGLAEFYVGGGIVSVSLPLATTPTPAAAIGIGGVGVGANVMAQGLTGITVTFAKISQEVMRRGKASEERVLKEEGLTKNRKFLDAADPKTGQPGRTQPDSLDKGQTVDVKDVKRLSLTKQLRLQNEISKEAGKRGKVFTGVKTRVYRPAERTLDIKRRRDLGPQEEP